MGKLGDWSFFSGQHHNFSAVIHKSVQNFAVCSSNKLGKVRKTWATTGQATPTCDVGHCTMGEVGRMGFLNWPTLTIYFSAVINHKNLQNSTGAL